MKKKLYTENYLELKFNKLKKDEKIDILYEALDYMQQYNGRSRFTCIAMAMGYENIEGLKDTWTKPSEQY